MDEACGAHRQHLHRKQDSAPLLKNFSIAAPLDLRSTGVARLTQVGMRLEDLSYLSAEQLRDERPTKCSDVYAFGVLAFQMLACRGWPT